MSQFVRSRSIFLLCSSLAMAFTWSETPATSGENSLRARLRLARDRIQIGEPLEISISYGNVAESPFYLFRTQDFGTPGIRVIASIEGCEYETSQQHFDGSVGDERFQFVPLWPGDSFEASPLELNDPQNAAGNVLAFPKAGTYSIRVVFTSRGSEGVGPFWPIWRGAINSDVARLVVEPQGQETVARWRERLRVSLARDDAGLTAIKYFSMVRDAEAAGLLAAAMERDPMNPFLAGALVAQGRSQDAVLLERLAMAEKNAGWRDALLRMTARLRSACP